MPTLIDIPKDFTNTGKDIYVLNRDYAIVEEVKNILGTQVRSRLFNIYFGSDIQNYLFSPMSSAVVTIIRKIIKETIMSNCKDIRNVSSNVSIKDDMLYIKLILTTDKLEIETDTRFYLRG